MQVSCKTVHLRKAGMNRTLMKKGMNRILMKKGMAAPGSCRMTYPVMMLCNCSRKGTLRRKPMNGSFNTDYGKIVINNKVIARIAGFAALECFGIVGMAALSRRDGIVKLLTRNSIAKGIKVEIDTDNVTIDLHVIVAYGVAVSAVTENLVSNVKYAVENMTGFNVSKINIYVEGVRVID